MPADHRLRMELLRQRARQTVSSAPSSGPQPTVPSVTRQKIEKKERGGEKGHQQQQVAKRRKMSFLSSPAAKGSMQSISGDPRAGGDGEVCGASLPDEGAATSAHSSAASTGEPSVPCTGCLRICNQDFDYTVEGMMDFAWVYPDGRGSWCRDCYNVWRTYYKGRKTLVLFAQRVP